MTAMAAVDLGAQSGRVVLGRFDGQKLAISEVHRFPNRPFYDGGRLQWDIQGLYRDVLDGLRAARSEDELSSVGVDSWGVDFGLIDVDGRLVQNPTHYRDARRAAAFEGVLERIPPRELYEKTGVQLLPINSLFELAAMAEEGDPALELADTLLLVPDLLHHWLCGSKVSERTNATTTQFLDAHTGQWAEELLELVGAPTRLLTDLVEPCTVLGHVSDETGADCGIEGVRVVAVATHDTGSAVAAVPFRHLESIYISAGTWSLVGLERDGPLIDDLAYDANLTNEGGVGGTVRLLRNVTGLWLLDECRRAWAEAGHDWSYDELIALADASPSLHAFVDPDDPRFGQPGDMPERIRAFCAETDQEPVDDPGTAVRCILESLALKHAYAADLLVTAAGSAPQEAHVVGGGSRNELLCQFTADALGLPVVAGPEEATAIGNLLGQAMAVGEIASLEEARDVVRGSFPQRVYEPAGASEWLNARERFATVVDRRDLGVSA